MSPWSRKRWRTVLQLRKGALYFRIPADIAHLYRIQAGDRLYVLPPSSPPVEIPEGERPLILVRFDLGGFPHDELARDLSAVPQPEPTGG